MDLSRRRYFRGQFRSTETQLRMPWLVMPEQFTDLCTRCGDCLAACPEQIVVKGDGGFPELDFKLGECSFCGQCADACAESLFSQDRCQQPWDYVANITDDCFAKNSISCRSCQDACEPAAIRFQLKIGGAAEPSIDTELCSGCGACVAVCPKQAVSIQPCESTDARSQYA
jgi:ferredoxin-type protein NapF